ncbi:hypothetical protein [Pandoravirus japonicus]|uniref:Uncharacterized protein n=1 Tax=Pandoravirus japonicus TaxID=2823154 RepID=A0A811BRE1_9VIRU|nr:hypothetical protein [Pandoravirus japonicus]
MKTSMFTYLALLLLTLVAVKADNKCFTCELPDYNCYSSCAVVQSYINCLDQGCQQCGDETQVAQYCQEAVAGLNSQCAFMNCDLSCDVINGCGGGSDGLATKWIVIIAVGGAAGLVVIAAAFIFIRRRRSADYTRLSK